MKYTKVECVKDYYTGGDKPSITKGFYTVFQIKDDHVSFIVDKPASRVYGMSVYDDVFTEHFKLHHGEFGIKPLGNPHQNWKQTISQDKYKRCIKNCIDLGANMFYNPKTNCFYGKDWDKKDSTVFLKHNLSRAPESTANFVDGVKTCYDEWLEENDRKVMKSVEQYRKTQDKECVEKEKKDEYTGGSVDYYKLFITNPTTLEESYWTECNDIIETLDMNYAEGNAFKAIWRKCASRKYGTKKKGYDNGLYDSEKVVFFGERMVVQSKGDE